MEQSISETQEQENVVSAALRGSYKAGFADVLRLAYNDAQADHVLLGDTGHKYYEQFWGLLGQKETLIAATESGVAHLFAELPHYRQSLVDEFQDAALNRPTSLAADKWEFSQHFEHDDDVENNVARWNFAVEGKTQHFLQNYAAPVVGSSAKLGMEAHLVDYRLGRSEYKAQKQACDIDNNPQTCPDLRTEYYFARHRDEPVARSINEIAAGGKTLIEFGAPHGSRYGDFEEFLEGRALKIDVAPNRRAYEQDYGEEIIDKIRTDVSSFGEDAPDLVYLIEEGAVLTTRNTPEDVAALVQEQFSPVSFDLPEAGAQSQDAQQVSTPKVFQ